MLITSLGVNDNYDMSLQFIGNVQYLGFGNIPLFLKEKNGSYNNLLVFLCNNMM